MAPGFAEHLDHEVGAAVDHLGMIAEIRLGVDHAEKLDQSLDAREVADRGFGDCEQLQAREARRFVALLDGSVLAQTPDHETAVRALRPLPGEEEEIARQAIGHVIGHRRRNGWKREAERGKPLFRSRCRHGAMILKDVWRTGWVQSSEDFFKAASPSAIHSRFASLT